MAKYRIFAKSLINDKKDYIFYINDINLFEKLCTKKGYHYLLFNNYDNGLLNNKIV